MFFTMLKNDLKKGKGLNIVLSLFMISASILMVVSGIQIYTFLEGSAYSHNVCNSSDLNIMYSINKGEKEIITETVDNFLNQQDFITDYRKKDTLAIPADCLDIENFDEQALNWFFENQYSIETQSMEYNRCLDLHDQPFQVVNGTIALPQNLKDITEVNIGDKLWITTQMGTTYEFTVAHFYKEVMNTSVQRLLISKEDLAVLEKESIDIGVRYEFKFQNSWLENKDLEQDFIKILREQTENEKDFYYIQRSESDQLDEESLQMYIVSCLMIIISIFMILIILMTIRFTMISAIDSEKKELGMLKAIGVDSFSFRWLFAAKYIGFSVISGLIGIIAGIPIGREVLIMFNKNKIAPTITTMVLVGAIASILICFVIILFSLLVMRRINKISVIKVLHGMDGGENYKKTSKLSLNERKKLPVFVYLAISDIKHQLRKYAFLITSYILGFLVILCLFHLKDSVLSKEFSKYSLMMDMDFHLDFDEELTNYYWEKTGDYYHMMNYINQAMDDAGIPAKYWMEHQTFGTYNSNSGEDESIIVIYGDYDVEKFNYREGYAPKLENEIALSYATSKREGYKIGDTISLKYNEYSENKLIKQKVTKEYIISGFFDYLESYDDFKGIVANCNGVWDGAEVVSIQILAPENEKEYYFQKIEALFGEDNVKTFEEAMNKGMSSYNQIFTLLRNVLSIVVIIVLILISYLYCTVLLVREIPEIALLKSMGLEDKDIRKWQMLRVFILLFLSILVSYIIHNTIGQMLIAKLFEFIDLTGFRYVIEPVKTYLLLPITLIVIVMLTVLSRLKMIKDIEIWKVREE